MSTSAQSRPLRDIFTLEKGKPPIQSPYDGPGSERYLTPDFLRGKAEPEYVRPSSNAVRVIDGEAIVLWDGSNAGEVFRARNGILASTMMRVRNNSNYDTGYFYYALKGWEGYLKSQTAGSGIPHVDKEILGGLSLFHCQKTEQTKIAEILSTVDQAIEQTEALIAKQQRIKTGLMQDLLTRGIDEDGNLRSEGTHKFKDSPIGRIPVEWKIRRLDAVAKVKYGISDAIDIENHSGIPTITLPCVTPNGDLDLSPEKLAFTPFERVREKDLLRRGDLLFNWRNGSQSHLGKTAYFDGNRSFTHVGFILRVRANEELVAARFLWYLINDLKSKGFFLNAKIQVNNTYNSNELNALELAFPQLEEQQMIRDGLDRLEASKAVIFDHLKKLRSLKTALMQDLLTGDVRVTSLLSEEAPHI